MAINPYQTLAQMNPQAVRTVFDGELRRNAILQDIYTNLRAPETELTGDNRMSIPAGIYGSITARDLTGANNIRVFLKLPINANIIRGAGVAIGTEVAPQLRSGSLFRNNYRFVAQDEPGYGVDKLDASYLKVYQEHVKDLGPHARAQEGLDIRMAHLETYGWNLMAGATQNVCPAQWNRHFFVAGLRVDQQPVFHPNYATYTNRIVAAMNLASGGNGQFAATEDQMLKCTTLDQIAIFALRRRLFPLRGKRPYFVLTVSENTAAMFTNPKFSDSMGDRWLQVHQLNGDIAQTWNGIAGKFSSAVGYDIYVVIDERLPMLLPGGSASPYTLSPYYVWPTENDDRPLDNSRARDACILHGMGGVVNWEPEKIHNINWRWDYDLQRGYGYAGVRGIQQLQYDTSPAGATGATRIYSGSAIVVVARNRI
jgi:hypothetical protein